MSTMTLAERLDGSQPLPERKRALIELVDTASPALKGFLISCRVPAERREIMVSDVWTIVIEKVQDGAFHAAVGEKADVNQPKKYVIGIAANIARRTNASATHETDLTNEEDIPDMTDDFAVADNKMDFARAAQLLTDPEDLAVLAALLVEKTIPDMVKEFAVPYKTVWRRYHRCLDHCREVLQVANGGEAHDVA